MMLGEGLLPAAEGTTPADPVVLGYDGSPASAAALHWAARQAGALQCPLQLVHAVHEYWLMPQATHYDAVIAAARGLLQSGARQAEALVPGLHVSTHVHSGDVVGALSELSASARLVVLGTDKRDAGSGELTGAVSQQVAVMSFAPVAVIPPLDLSLAAGVVVGTDGSAEARQAVAAAAAEASMIGTDLLVLTSCAISPTEAWAQTPGGEEYERVVAASQGILDKAVSAVTASYPGISVSSRLETQLPAAEALISAASAARLLVVGSLGRGAVRRMLLGSVSHKVLLNPPCPTLITRLPQ
ncbi:universal stress protein [Arthrobacter sp. Br18]|uniref:universal stress protein n=1 Tax=Arthrobacter sp. Br18 TaxID=1312954 RepID=UPI0006870D65|nr:universal stress protein [Arthrobacter sp. Br18]